jgi:hypothetical protein
MSSLANVKTKFDLRLEEKFKTKPDVLKFLKNHERKNIVLNRLCEEIVKCERFCVTFNVNKYLMVINSVADMFASNALNYIEQQMLSDAEKNRLIKKADAIKEAENVMMILEKEVKDEEKNIRVFLNENG